MQTWYLVVQKRAKGNPFGYTDVFLSNQFKSMRELESIGDMPWYAGPSDLSAKVAPLPKSGLVLISSDKRYSFDLRSIGGFERMFAMSGRCYEIVRRLRTNFIEVVPARFVDRENNTLSGAEYWIARTERVSIESVAKKGGRTKFNQVNGRSVIETLDVDDHVGLDLFTLEGLPTTQDTLICSERFHQECSAAGLLGIDFLDLTTTRWPKATNPDDQSDFLAMLTEPSATIQMI